MSTTAPANERPKTASRGAFLRRVRIRNYKSIANCDVELGSLTILVGRNGAGKSNFLDALRFVSNAVRTSLTEAIGLSGGSDAVWRKGVVNPAVVAFELDLDLGSNRRASYSFEIARAHAAAIGILSEGLVIKDADDKAVAFYRLENGDLVGWSERVMPPVADNHLYLTTAAGLPVFRPVWDSLLMLGFYNLDPVAMRWFQIPDAGEILRRDGGNIASVIGRMASQDPELKEWIKGYLPIVVPGVSDFDAVRLGPVETLTFFQTISGSNPPVVFYALNMSDGTLRTLGALVAIAQLAMEPPSVRLVGIEEPETAIHPAAAAALMDAMQEAAVDGQVIVTTHSPDLLDSIDLESDRLLVVQMRDGVTEIGSVDSASRQIIQEHLYSPGELLRMNQLEPDWNDLQRQSSPVQSVRPSE